MTILFKPKRNLRHIYYGLLLAVLVAFPFFAASYGNSWVRIMDMALLYVMMALGLNLVVGFAGLLDLGYIAFYALGAYMAGLLASPQFPILLDSMIAAYPAAGIALAELVGPEIARGGIHLSVWLIVPLAAALAGIFGALLGAPTLRLRGDYLAMVTLGFGEVIRILIHNLTAPVNITDGPRGINMIDPVSIFGISLHGEPGTNATVKLGFLSMPSVNAYYYLFLVLCIAIILVSVRMQHSRLGRAFIAIREDEVAARAMGINTRNIKLLAFAMGASFGGVAGAMFAAFQGFISPESFSLTESITVLSMVILGGIGHIPGVILGAVMLAALPEILRHIVEPLQLAALGHVLVPCEVMRQLLLGLVMVLVMLNRPAGLWPAPAPEDRPIGNPGEGDASKSAAMPGARSLAVAADGFGRTAGDDDVVVQTGTDPYSASIPAQAVRKPASDG
ncbi:MAG TPA: ABC transporter ATP-binding protein [Noviherbaspirillum sp.]|uniref:branched-chain amino acid ABC transporter permease n=1 Tax=Noviherbaspirillum sp. TaxID=1926288 RepID=UPI002D2D5D7E|nr:ABC transporter ATP-binding protein [Noviherbaspirillum sp.]HYD95132.1 ABC transporter ATP-binding protein [Noviherbaspirillum sp.]